MNKLTDMLIENIEDHLRSRGMDPDRTGIMLDKKNGIAHFLLYNLSGQLVGYQRYNPNGDKKDHSNSLMAKYYNYVTKEGNASKLAVWGLESLKKDLPFMIVTEGIFDAVKAQNAGYPAIALLSNNPKHLRSWFKVMQKKIVAIVDNDAAGSMLKKYADHVIEVSGGKDLGDLSNEEAKKLIDSEMKKLNFNSNKNIDGKIINPMTKNRIKITTALKYPKDHPAYKLAKQTLRNK